MSAHEGWTFGDTVLFPPIWDAAVGMATDVASTAAPHRSSGWVPAIGVAAAWALSRAIVVGLATATLSRGRLFNDPNLLWAWANGAAFGADASPELGEYPGLARVLASSARLAPTPDAFGWGWIAAMLAVDLIVLVVLWRMRPAAGWFWVVAGALLGPVMWLRYDLLVALLALLGVTLRDRRPTWAGVALGVAVLLKLWPLVLLPALLLRGDTRRWALAAGATIGSGVLLEAAVRGPTSVLTPLTYQTERGWQIESLWATPTLLRERGAEPGSVWEFAFRAYQLQGTGSPVATVVAVLVLGLAAAGVLVACRRVGRTALPQVRATGAATLATLLVAANTVFSPQYVIWLIPLVGLVVGRARGRVWPLVSTSLAVAALTQAVWPWGYDRLLALDDAMLTVLALRNLLVVALAAMLAWRLVTTVRQPASLSRGGTTA